MWDWCNGSITDSKPVGTSSNLVSHAKGFMQLFYGDKCPICGVSVSPGKKYEFGFYCFGTYKCNGILVLPLCYKNYTVEKRIFRDE